MKSDLSEEEAAPPGPVLLVRPLGSEDADPRAEVRQGPRTKRRGPAGRWEELRCLYREATNE